MAGPLDAIIARGFAPLDIAGDIYRQQAQQQEQALRRQQMQAATQQMQMQQQMMPLKMQAAQQLAQENTLKLQEAQADAQDQQTIKDLAADPIYGGNMAKVSTAAIGKIRPKAYYALRADVTKENTDQASQAKSKAELAELNTKHNSDLAYGALNNGSAHSFGGYLDHAVADGSMTQAESDAIANEHMQAPDPDAWARTHLLGKLTPADRKIYDENLEKGQKATREQATADIGTAAQDADLLEPQIKADPTHADDIWKQFKATHAGATKGMGDTFSPEYIPFLRSRPIDPKDRPAYEQAQNTARADAAMTREGWTDLIKKAVEPERVPAVQAMVDAEPNPTKKRAIIQQVGLQKPGAEEAMTSRVVAALGKPESEQTPEEKRLITGYKAQRAITKPPAPVVNVDTAGPAAADPASAGILGQTGLSMAGFYTLTGQGSKLPRDPATRKAALFEAQQFANKRGIDVSTLASQYKTFNDVLSSNIDRLNRTKIMEDELNGTIDNLKGVAKEADLSKLNIANVLKIWGGQEINDPLAQQYAVHLYQLRNELAAYGAATQGRTGGSITVQDEREAEQTIKNGISGGSLDGLQKAVKASTDKMGQVMGRSVDTAQKAVWDLFGVGANYKPKAPAAGGGAPPLPRTLSDSDVGKVYRNAAGKNVKIKAVNPNDRTKFKFEEAP